MLILRTVIVRSGYVHDDVYTEHHSMCTATSTSAASCWPVTV